MRVCRLGRPDRDAEGLKGLRAGRTPGGRDPQTGSAPRGSGLKAGKAGAGGWSRCSQLRLRFQLQRCGLGTAMALRAGCSWWLGGVLLFALLAAGTASLSWDLPEPRSRASKIRVHSRGNLWATGHFMGKKSLEPPSPSLLGTAPDTSLRDQRLQLSHELFRILLLKKALGTSPGGPAPHTQEAAGANAAEVMPLMRKTRQRGLDCAHRGKVLNGTLLVAPFGCKSWTQVSVTPLL